MPFSQFHVTSTYRVYLNRLLLIARKPSRAVTIAILLRF